MILFIIGVTLSYKYRYKDVNIEILGLFFAAICIEFAAELIYLACKL